MGRGDDLDNISEINQSGISRKESNRLLILDFIRKNSPVAFPRIVRELDIKRTTALSIVRDLEFSRLIFSYFVTDDYGRNTKWLKIRSEQ